MLKETVISSKEDIWGSLKEALDSREVLFMLAWRDILVRYKQAILGLGWSLLRPIITMAIFVVVFGRVARLPSDGVPYPLLVMSALLPWMFFAHTITIGASALIDNSNMLRRTFFPRIVMPTTSIVIHLSDCLLSFVVFCGLALFYGFAMDARVLFFPVLLIHVTMLSLGMVYFLSVLAVRWRDIIYVVPFAIQIGFFVSPIGYSTTLIPEDVKYFFYLNPIVGLVEGSRWSLLAGRMPVHWDAYLISLAISILLFVTGVVFFIREDKKIADIL